MGETPRPHLARWMVGPAQRERGKQAAYARSGGVEAWRILAYRPGLEPNNWSEMLGGTPINLTCMAAQNSWGILPRQASSPAGYQVGRFPDCCAAAVYESSSLDQC